MLAKLSTSRTVDGILSSEPKDNPYLWNANHIYVPYCSSDSWTGQQEARADQAAPSFTFMGSRIIERVLDSLFDDLPRETSLYESKFVLLAGDSAGATGVILNLDKVNRLVLQRFNASNEQQQRSARQAPVLRGLADSGWFLDNEPYDFSFGLQADWVTSTLNSQTPAESQELDCDRQRCTPLQSSRQAMLYWNGHVPTACATRQTAEPWRCYFAHHAYQSLKTPLFVVQWLYDEAQLLVDNIVRPNTVDQWNYVNKLVNEMRHSLENVTALFAPSCFSHSLITKQSWNQININGFRLPHVLNSWEEEVLSNQPTLEALLSLDQPELASQTQLPVFESNQQTAPLNQRAELAGFATSRFITDKRPARFQKAANFELRTTAAKAIAGSNSNSMQTSQTVNPRPKGRKKRRNNSQQHPTSRVAIMTNRLSRSTSTLLDDATPVFSNNVPDLLLATTSRQQEGADKFRLIDTCGWPQCNRDCPSLDQELNMRPILPY